MRVLLTRPLDDSLVLSEQVSRQGHQSIISPVLKIATVAWELPDEEIDALVLTSHHAVPVQHLDQLGPIPCFCIGERTTAAARAAGFTVAADGEGNRNGLVRKIADVKPRHILFLSGEQERGDMIAELAAVHIPATRRIVYRAESVTAFTPEAVTALQQNEIDWVLLYSPRSAGLFCQLVSQLPVVDKSHLRLACLSQAVADACTEAWADANWAQVVIANRPSSSALLAAAGLICDTALHNEKDQ
jgi:uroporphyrinogen-III synthase